MKEVGWGVNAKIKIWIGKARQSFGRPKEIKPIKTKVRIFNSNIKSCFYAWLRDTMPDKEKGKTLKIFISKVVWERTGQNSIQLRRNVGLGGKTY